MATFDNNVRNVGRFRKKMKGRKGIEWRQEREKIRGERRKRKAEKKGKRGAADGWGGGIEQNGQLDDKWKKKEWDKRRTQKTKRRLIERTKTWLRAAEHKVIQASAVKLVAKISKLKSESPTHLFRREERPNLIKGPSEHRAATGPWNVPCGCLATVQYNICCRPCACP